MRVQQANRQQMALASGIWGNELVRIVARAMADLGEKVAVTRDVLWQRTLYRQLNERKADHVSLLMRSEALAQGEHRMRALGFTPDQRPTIVGRHPGTMWWSPTLSMAVVLASRCFPYETKATNAAALLARARLESQLFDCPVLIPDPYDQACLLIGDLALEENASWREDLRRLASSAQLSPVDVAHRLTELGLIQAAKHVLATQSDSPPGAWTRACLDALPARAPLPAATKSRASVASPSLAPERAPAPLDRNAIFAALLRGEPLAPDTYSQRIPELVRAANGVWIAPLLYHVLTARREAAFGLTSALGPAFRDAQRAEERLGDALREVFTQLARNGLPCLVLKGTGLAYTDYDEPALRPRIDTDLLFPSHVEAERAAAALADLGFEPEPHAAKHEVLSTQRTVSKKAREGTPSCVLDLHWRTNNHPLYARMLPFDELYAESRPVPALGPAARTLGPAHAMLLACVHLVRHAPTDNPDTLLWLYDVRLLASLLSPAQWEQVVARASTRGVAHEIEEALRRALRVGAEVPSNVSVAFQRAAQRSRRARLQAMLGGRAHLLQREIDALWSLPDWPSRARYLREQFLPGSEYMRARYPDSHHPLPTLYVYRAARGVWRALLR